MKSCPEMHEKQPEEYENQSGMCEKLPEIFENQPAMHEKLPETYEKLPGRCEKLPGRCEKYPGICEKHPDIITSEYEMNICPWLFGSALMGYSLRISKSASTTIAMYLAGQSGFD